MPKNLSSCVIVAVANLGNNIYFVYDLRLRIFDRMNGIITLTTKVAERAFAYFTLAA